MMLIPPPEAPTESMEVRVQRMRSLLDRVLAKERLDEIEMLLRLGAEVEVSVDHPDDPPRIIVRLEKHYR